MINITREDLITGDKFRQVARDLGLTFVYTHELSRLIQGLWHSTAPINLISHMSDGCILPKGQVFKPRPMTRVEDFTWENVPSNIRYWFAQNCNVRDSRLIPIPIGVENDEWANPQQKKEIILSLRIQPVQKTGLAYLNVNPVTNWSRPPLYARFIGQKWCTTEQGKNGVDFLNYAQKICSHKFVFCPEGNGMSTHRTYETLYLGSFPIVRRRVFTEAFAELLPFVLIDSWEEVTEKFLDEKYEEFTSRVWTWEALTMGYWEKLIREKISED